MRMLAEYPVLLVKNVGLQSMQLHSGTRGPVACMWTLLQKLQAIPAGAGERRRAAPPNFSGMNMNSTQRKKFHQKIKKMAGITQAPEYRGQLGKTLSS